MRMTIYYSGPRNGNMPFGEVRLQSLTGQSGLGHHRLVFNFHIATNPKPPDATHVRLMDLKCEVAAQLPKGTPVPLGFLTAGGQTIRGELPEQGRSGGFTAMMYLEADSRRIKALDDLRNGGGLHLLMRLRPEIVCDGRAEGQIVELHRDLNQSDCIELLRSAGYSDRELIEIPSADAMADEQLKKAVQDVHAAASHLRTGHWRPAVASCRDSVEALGTALGDGEFVNRANIPGADLFQNLRAMSKEARLQLLRRALMALTAPAHHRDEHVQHIEWSPEEARATVAIVSALVSLYGQEG